MQTPYQQMVVNQAPVYPAVAQPAAADVACCPPCCSRVGECPCFCTGYTAAFSVALASIWMALPMMATAAALTDLFEVSVYGINYVWMGMWQACGYTSDTYWDCSTYNSDDMQLIAPSSALQFNAMRSLTLAAGALSLITGILGAIRLARLQRSKPNSPALNNSLLLSALLTLGSAGAAFGLTFPLLSTMNDEFNGMTNGMASATFGVSWVMLVVGTGLLTVGVSLHLIAHCCYQYNAVIGEDSEQPGLYSAAGYPASSSIFSHPQPLHVAVPTPAVYYPTAAALHYPAPQYVQPPMGHIYQ